MCTVPSVGLNRAALRCYRAPVCNEITDGAETGRGGEHMGEICEVCVKVGKTGRGHEQTGR